jgi:hypothetical protein
VPHHTIIELKRFQEGSQLQLIRLAPELAQGYGFNLPDLFPRHGKTLTDLFERTGISVLESEALSEASPRQMRLANVE